MQTYTNQIAKSNQVLANGASKLATAKALLNRMAKAKPRYSIEDVTDGDIVDVSFYDQYGKFYGQAIPKELLISFAADFYRDTVDTFFDDQHYQYVDGRSAAEYVEENLNEVITDYLNNAA